MQTIEDAKAHLRANFHAGTNCPVCTQRVQLYRHKLTGPMVKTLIDMYRLTSNRSEQWVHVMDEIKPINGDYAKLRHWGLLEARGDVPEPSKKASGYWRLTKLGEDFIKNKALVHEYALLFDNRSWGFAGNTINIKQALGNKFNYTELMAGVDCQLKMV